MSSPNGRFRKSHMINQRRFLVVFLSLLFLASGCTVQPLHSPTGSDADVSVDVKISPVDTRLEQQVRNRLLFLLNGGSAEPSNARFLATLDVTSARVGLLRVQRSSSESDTTTASLRVTGTLELTTGADEDSTKIFKRVVSVSYDRTTQFFANSRAEIDAENRAAAELAEELRNLVLVYVKSQ